MLQTPSSGVARPVAHIRKIGVLGAGVMGAQIAAHCVNAGVPVVLFDLPAKGDDRNGIAHKAIAQLKKLNPAPLAHPDLAARIRAANYGDDLELLGDCDLIIEAIAERLDYKRDLYHKIAAHVAPHAILASNTSGLSIESLSQALPDALKHRFCGVHFFNPPRYMPLVELIPTAATKPHLLDQLETFLVSVLGKSVVRARDTPNFIGNRIGVFGILSTMIEAERAGLTYEQVDELTGSRLGRAKSGTFRTADVVGLDTLAHVIKTMQDGLPNDPFRAHFATPAVLAALLEKGALGQKTGAGFYRKEGKSILRLDPKAGGYVPADARVDDDVAAILAQRDPVKRMAALHASDHPQARFVWALLRDTFHYSAVHLADIADTARDVDFAMRWGFGHGQGPFELWQSAGWTQIAQWIEDDIASGAALSNAPLPEWVRTGPVADAGGVHTAAGSWNPASERFEPRSNLPVYARQLFPPLLAGEQPGISGNTVFEDDAVRAWTLPAPHPERILIVSFKTKMHTISPAVTAGLLRAIALAEERFEGVVVWQPREPFSAGADLQGVLDAVQKNGPGAIEQEERNLQDAAQRMRYAQVPTVVALSGLALGGGCELSVHASQRVAHLETYIGLVEVGVGLIPGAGGLTFCARRAAELHAQVAPDQPLLSVLKRFAEAVAGATVSKSALEARQIGYLRESDPVVMNVNELLYVAVHQAHGLAVAGYRPPVAVPFAVAGRDGAATLSSQLLNLRDGGFISDYDYELGRHVARILCGGDVDPGTLVDEEYLLALERRAFLTLLGQEKTQARIGGLLKTGKPLRN